MAEAKILAKISPRYGLYLSYPLLKIYTVIRTRLQKTHALLVSALLLSLPLQAFDAAWAAEEHGLSSAEAVFTRQALALDATRELRPELGPATATRLDRAAAAHIFTRDLPSDLTRVVFSWVPPLRRLLGVRRKGGTPQTPAPVGPPAGSDLDHLLLRIDRHVYPETLEIMTAYWFRTLRTKLYQEKDWRRLQKGIQRHLLSGALSEPKHRLLKMVADWIPAEIAASRLRPSASTAHLWLPGKAGEAIHSDEWLSDYLASLLNRWLPQEIARPIEQARADQWWEGDEEFVARALAQIVFRDIRPADADYVERMERILGNLTAPKRSSSRRSRLSLEDMEALLWLPVEATLVHPMLREVLNDILLYYLQRTAPAPAFETMPVRSLYAYGGAELPEDLAECIARAKRVDNQGTPEISVPLSEARKAQITQVSNILFRGAVLITPDGATWVSDRWEIGATTSRVFRRSGQIGLSRRSNALELIVPILPLQRGLDMNTVFAHEAVAFGYRWRPSKLDATDAQTRIIFRVVGVLPISRAATRRTALLSAKPARAAGHSTTTFLAEALDAFYRGVSSILEALDRRSLKEVTIQWQALQTALYGAWQADTLKPLESLSLTEAEREAGHLLFNLIRLIEAGEHPHRDNPISFVETSLNRLRNWVYPNPPEGEIRKIRKIPWNILPAKIQRLIYQVRSPGGSMRTLFRQPLEDIFEGIPALPLDRFPGPSQKPVLGAEPSPQGGTPPETGILRSA